MVLEKELSNVLQITKEIRNLLKEIEEKENVISEKITTNSADILVYKTILETVIEEYHLICKKIYN